MSPIFLLPVLFGLVPLTWFKPGFQLASEDMDLLMDPARWWSMWYSWNPQYNTGVNYSFALAGQLFEALPAGLHLLGLTITAVQKIQSVFWFTLQGFGITYLMHHVVRARHPWVATAVAASFYLFNLYQENVWLSMDIAKLSASVALPVMLAEFLRLLEGTRSLRRALVTIAAASLLGAGIGMNPPMALVVVGAFGLAFACHVVVSWGWRRPEVFWRPLRQSITVAMVIAACHLFWILPLMDRLQHDIPTEGQGVSRAWLNDTSANTSFANVCRFRGDWTWYQGWKEPYRPYAALYQQHGGLVVLGWLIPLVVLFGILNGRTRYKFLFLMLTMLGLALSMGTHPPMAAVYRWLIDHVPMFWTFRSPWYKFTLWTCVGYAVFMGLAADAAYDRWIRFAASRDRSWAHRIPARLAAGVLAGGLIAANLVYAFPVTAGRMYTTAEQRQFLPPNHVRIPPYVWEAAHWVDAQYASRGFFRILILPESESWTYSWGLGSHSPVVLPLSRVPVLLPMGIVGVAPEQPLLRALYRDLYRGSSATLNELLRLLNIRYLLHETDLKYWIPAGDTDDPPFIRAALAQQTGVARGPTFGAWEFYEVGQPYPRFYHAPTATLVVGSAATLGALTHEPTWLTPPLLLTTDLSATAVSSLLKEGAINQIALSAGAEPPTLPPELPVLLVATSPSLARQVDPSALYQLEGWTGFGPPLPDGWRALQSNSVPNWTLVNSAAGPQELRIEGTVRSPKAPRSLYAYLDQQLVTIAPIPAETRTNVALNLTLSPGPHQLAWYSPDARTVEPDGQQVGFYFASDWVAGPPAYVGTWPIPRAGAYRLRLIKGRGTTSITPALRLHGHAVAWQTGGPDRLRATVTLPAGSCPLILQQLGDAPWTLIATPSDQPPVVPRPVTPLSPTHSTPTAHMLPAPPGSGWIIFSEAYHPGWQVAGAPTVTHEKVNGFANGFWVPTPPGGSLQVAFTPQRWAVAGGVALVIAIAGLIVWGVWGRRAR